MKIHTNAEIYKYNEDIENIIDDILDTHLRITEQNEKSLKPIALFFVDPCGKVSWNNVIQKNCERVNKKQGTGMLLNWSWDVISRTLDTELKNSVLSNIYGIPIKEVQNEFKDGYCY